MLLVNMIALLVYSLAEKRCRCGSLEMTGREMLYEFAPLHAVETHCWDGSSLYRCMPLMPRQQEILQRMGLAGSLLLDTGAWITCTPRLPPPRGQPGFWEVEQVA